FVFSGEIAMPFARLLVFRGLILVVLQKEIFWAFLDDACFDGRHPGEEVSHDSLYPRLDAFVGFADVSAGDLVGSANDHRLGRTANVRMVVRGDHAAMKRIDQDQLIFWEADQPPVGSSTATIPKPEVLSKVDERHILSDSSIRPPERVR